MTGAPGSHSLWAAYGAALVELGESDSNLEVMESGSWSVAAAHRFRERFPSRFIPVDGNGPALVRASAGRSGPGHPVFVTTSAAVAAGEAYGAFRDDLCRPSANVKVFADEGGPATEDLPEAHLHFEDLGILRALPGVTVVVPADAPSARGAALAVHSQPGPAYVRLARGNLPTVTTGSFEIGRAAELRAGGDLTIVAVGPLVASALAVAGDLEKVGVSTRVLDFASVKPFDEPAVLRAARDTGAILVLEEHSVLTGVGALVASTTSENHPVPVRRVGIPDLFVDEHDPRPRFERYGLGAERIRDEAWELLRLRGKVT
jgi:transketolase